MGLMGLMGLKKCTSLQSTSSEADVLKNLDDVQVHTAAHCGDEHGSGVEQQFIQDNRCNGRTHLPKR